MRLNLGCGLKKMDGWVNVDHSPACAPDRVVDLERFPWPFADDAAQAVELRHVLEHLGATPEIYLGVIRELYRVCAPDARIRITVPHPRHDDFLSDPTHVRPVTPQGLELFDRVKNREWAEKGMPNSPLGLYLDVDFAIEAVNMRPDQPWRGDLEAGRLKPADLMQAVRRFNNVIKETEIVLRAVKPGRG
ncbi:MAG: class I SAM-dependent methyltransferase [Alphaproteobacteria bacterium]